jgi:formate--tetrahydrofolate ligase
VLVVTARALKMHGGVARADLAAENVAALKKGLANVDRHVRNLGQFGVPVVVAVNRFDGDGEAELKAIARHCAGLGVEAHVCSHWADGGAGIEPLARQVAALADGDSAQFRPLYPDEMPLWEKLRTIARSIYGADDVIGDRRVRDQVRHYQDEGFGHLPICVAKTQYSFSTDPALLGAPSNHVVPVREVRLAAGAEFVVAICGDIMTMPGLPREPSAVAMRLDAEGRIEGLS